MLVDEAGSLGVVGPSKRCLVGNVVGVALSNVVRSPLNHCFVSKVKYMFWGAVHQHINSGNILVVVVVDFLEGEVQFLPDFSRAHSSQCICRMNTPHNFFQFNEIPSAQLSLILL